LEREKGERKEKGVDEAGEAGDNNKGDDKAGGSKGVGEAGDDDSGPLPMAPSPPPMDEFGLNEPGDESLFSDLPAESVLIERPGVRQQEKGVSSTTVDVPVRGKRVQMEEVEGAPEAG
jgi:hypothetical protein